MTKNNNSKPKFAFYFSDPIMTGGDLVLIKHAEYLKAAGYQVCLFLVESSYNPPAIKIKHRLKEFPPDIPHKHINFLDDLRLEENQFLIMGEVHHRIYYGVEKNNQTKQLIIYCQSKIYILNFFTTPEFFKNFNLGGFIANSQVTYDFISKELGLDLDAIPHQIIQPHINLHHLQDKVDQKIANLSKNSPFPQRKVKVAININPRKRSLKANTDLLFLKNFYQLDRYVEFIIFDSLTQDKLHQTLLESDIFINYAFNESFGMMAREAMALGNLVVGFRGINDPQLDDSVGIWFDYPTNPSYIDHFKEADDLAAIFTNFFLLPQIFVNMISKARQISLGSDEKTYQKYVIDNYKAITKEMRLALKN